MRILRSVVFPFPVMLGSPVQPSVTSMGTRKPTNADDAGNYTINVHPGWYGRVTPSKPLYIFLPTSMIYMNVQEAYSEQNYTAMEIHNTFLPLMIR